MQSEEEGKKIKKREGDVDLNPAVFSKSPNMKSI